MGSAGLSSRAHVRARLAALVDGLGTGAGWVTMLIGDTGTGKTRLLREVLSGREDITVAWGSVDAMATAEPATLDPWAQVAAAMGDGEMHAALEVVGRGSTTPPSPVAVAGMARAASDIAAHTPLVVVLDDLDAADDASIELLVALVPHLATAAVGVVATGCSRSATASDGAWARLEQAGEQLRLTGLTIEEVGAVGAEVAGAVLAPDVATSLHHRTGGNAREVATLVGGIASAELPDLVRTALFDRAPDPDDGPGDGPGDDPDASRGEEPDTLTGGPARRAELLVRAGDALVVAGQPDAGRALHHAAAAAARRAGDPVLLARAALGLGAGRTGFAVPLLDRGQVALLEEALAALPNDQWPWRSLVSARLSIALTHDDAEARRVRLADDALELARQARDPATLATALAARCDVRAGPGHARERADAATEIIALTRGPDPEGELLGRRLRLVARLELGDVHGAEADRDAFAAVADLLGEDRFAWYPFLWRAAWHLMHGHHRQAEANLDRAWALGRRAGAAHVEPLCMTHRWWALVEQGEHERMRPLMGELDTMPTVPWVRVAHALGMAESRRLNAAVVQLDAVMPSLPDLPRDGEWLPMLGQVAHVVGLVGGHPIAAQTYDALLLHRDRHLVEGIAAALLGSVERPLGVLAASLGDHDLAETHFRDAELANRRLGSPALVARTLRDAGVALDDRARLEAATVLYAELGWQQRVEELRDRVRALGSTGAARPGRRSESRLVAPTGTFRRDGDGWVVGWQDATARVADRKGLHDLAMLLDRPGRDVAALDLAQPGREPLVAIGGDLGPVADDQARRAYRNRLRALDDDVETARTHNDIVALERAEQERDALVTALSRLYGLGGRPRRAGDPAERARTTVTSRIRDAIAHLATVDPALGRHLDNSIRTGRTCSYQPEMPVEWAR